MTLATACTPRVVIIGNGTLGPYSLVDASSVAIRLVSTGHLKLTRYAASTDDNNDGTLLVLNTDYTVGGTQDARTFTLIGSQAVLTSSQRIVAERVQSYTQDLDLTTGGAFNASSVESRFDKMAEFQQELKARLDRTVPLQFADTTASVGFPSPPTSATQFLARNTTGEFVYATAADLSADVALGTDWATILGLPAAGILDNISGIRFVATYAALTALTTATGLSDNSVYYTYARTTEEDGGAGFWRYDSGSSATANAGTILAADSGTGRFFRLYDNVTVTPEWFGADGTTTNDTTAWQTLVTLGKAVECRKGRTYKINRGLTISADYFTLLGNGCTFEIQDGTGGFDTTDISIQFNASSTNTCLFYGLSREGLVFDNFHVTQSGSNERNMQVIGVREGHDTSQLRITNVRLRGLHSGRAYITVSSIGSAGYYIDNVSAKSCTIAGTSWTGGTPDVGLVTIDTDLVAGVFSVKGTIANIESEDQAFTGSALSTYADQTDVVTIGGTGNTHCPIIENVKGINVGEVVDCFGSHGAISNVTGENCIFVQKFVHGANNNAANNIRGKTIRAGGAVVTFAGTSTAGASDTHSNVVSNVTGEDFSATAFGILFQQNTGTTGQCKRNRVANAMFVAGSGTPPSYLVYDNHAGTIAETFTASSSSGLLLTHTSNFDSFQTVVFTTTTTLPTGLSLATTYWLVKVSATTSRVATSLINARTGTVVAYTNAGTGTHTMTVTQQHDNFVDGVDGQWLTQFCNVVAAPNTRIRATKPTHTILSLPGAQTIATATSTTLDFSTVVKDLEGIQDTANDRVVLVRPGFYDITVAARFTDLNADEEYHTRIMQNTTVLQNVSATISVSGDTPVGFVTYSLEILPSDIGTSSCYISGIVRQETGGDRTVGNTAAYTQFVIKRAA